MAITFNQGSVPALAGQMQFGQTGPDMWGETLNRITQLEKNPLFKELTPAVREQYRNAAMTSLFPSGDENIVRRILENQERLGSKEYQEQMLELADKYQTKKGIKQTAFNMFGSGFDNLMKGIGMSMNPYGTPEGLQNYLALTVAAPEAMAAGYRNVRTPIAIPAVQAPGAPTYF